MLSDAPVNAVIPAADMARAKHFYSDTLGLKVSMEMEGGVRYDAGGGTQFFVYQTPSAGQAAHTLASFVVADLDGEMADLRSRGVVFEDYDQPGLKTVEGVADMGEARGAWFKDSEGNILSLVQVRS
jgi:catechol 2,3-dioxygenase-like lactoylglutathione lyase family enzyme